MSMNRVSGYLECDGTIVRIASLEDIKDFLIRCGKSTNEMSEGELELLTEQKPDRGNLVRDDCDIAYSQNPKVLQWGVPIMSYKVEESTIAIADNAFALNSYSNSSHYCLTSILLPESIVAIGHSAFVSTRNLTRINLSSALILIGNMAFYDCNKLKDVVLPETTKYLGTRSFGRTGITTITIPYKVEKIGSFAFANCSQLKTVVFEGVPKDIGSEVFGGDTALEKITIPQGTMDYFIKALFPLPKDLFVEKNPSLG